MIALNRLAQGAVHAQLGSERVMCVQQCAPRLIAWVVLADLAKILQSTQMKMDRTFSIVNGCELQLVISIVVVAVVQILSGDAVATGE